MKSSSGSHFIGLDHIRALAAFMVFSWHFLHGKSGHPIPFESFPSFFPLSLLDEGHTGVALFMTLSGYLFAKLLNGKSVRYGAFFWNRCLRLLPLLLITFLINGIIKFVRGEDIHSYIYSLAKGFLHPVFLEGAWSVMVELHFYLTLPFLLWMFSRARLLPLSVIAAALILRYFLHHGEGKIQELIYTSIIGRVDQFVLGMVLYRFRDCFAHRTLTAMLTMIGFAAFYWYFDFLGGALRNRVSYFFPGWLWIFLPTIEGLAYAIIIAWLDTSFSPSTSGISGFIGRIGGYSYSIYLLHFFVVHRFTEFVHEQIMDISNFYLACLWSVFFFLLMVPVGYLSFRFIESPFLKLRRQYVH